MDYLCNVNHIPLCYCRIFVKQTMVQNQHNAAVSCMLFIWSFCRDNGQVHKFVCIQIVPQGCKISARHSHCYPSYQFDILGESIPRHHWQALSVYDFVNQLHDIVLDLRPLHLISGLLPRYVPLILLGHCFQNVPRFRVLRRLQRCCL